MPCESPPKGQENGRTISLCLWDGQAGGRMQVINQSTCHVQLNLAKLFFLFEVYF